MSCMHLAKILAASLVSAIVSALLLGIGDLFPSIGIELQMIILVVATFTGSAAYVIVKHRF